MPDQGSVLSLQRDEIGDRGQGDEVELALELRAEQCRRQLVGDRGRAQLAERIAADDGVQDRAVGKLGAWLVVVGDDHVDALLSRHRDLSRRGDPAVDGDQELRAAVAQAVDRRGGEAIAIVLAARDQPVAVGAELAQRPNRDRRRADTVDVVVAVDGDPLAARDRVADLRHDLVHAVEQEGVVVVSGVEERPRGLDRVKAAANERHRDRLGKVEAGHQRTHLGVVEGGKGERLCSLGHPPKLRTGLGRNRDGEVRGAVEVPTGFAGEG